jgi:hypothetical protein
MLKKSAGFVLGRHCSPTCTSLALILLRAMDLTCGRAREKGRLGAPADEAGKDGGHFEHPGEYFVHIAIWYFACGINESWVVTELSEVSN